MRKPSTSCGHSCLRGPLLAASSCCLDNINEVSFISHQTPQRTWQPLLELMVFTFLPPMEEEGGETDGHRRKKREQMRILYPASLRVLSVLGDYGKKINPGRHQKVRGCRSPLKTDAGPAISRACWELSLKPHTILALCRVSTYPVVGWWKARRVSLPPSCACMGKAVHFFKKHNKKLCYVFQGRVASDPTHELK